MLYNCKVLKFFLARRWEFASLFLRRNIFLSESILPSFWCLQIRNILVIGLDVFLLNVKNYKTLCILNATSDVPGNILNYFCQCHSCFHSINFWRTIMDIYCKILFLNRLKKQAKQRKTLGIQCHQNILSSSIVIRYSISVYIPHSACINLIKDVLCYFV